MDIHIKKTIGLCMVVGAIVAASMLLETLLDDVGFEKHKHLVGTTINLLSINSIGMPAISAATATHSTNGLLQNSSMKNIFSLQTFIRHPAGHAMKKRILKNILVSIAMNIIH